MTGPLLAGAPAFRDIGGLPATGGGRVRRGRVFRSDKLSGLSAQDADVLRSLGIRALMDLRSDGERRAHPNQLPHDLACKEMSCSVLTDVRAVGASTYEPLRRDPSPAGVREMMLGLYRAMPGAFAPHMRQLVQMITAGDLPLVIHCTAGKDRTGFAVAVLLSLLGVAREDIVQEYLLTGRHPVLPQRKETLAELLTLQLRRPPPEPVLQALLRADAAYLVAGFAGIDEDHGGLTAYLAGPCRLSREEIESVRAALLE